MMDDKALRKWCLEAAFETRALSDVPHMEVTNVADEYFQWIVAGVSRGSRLHEAAEEIRSELRQKAEGPMESIFGRTS